jgi:hypothetical protein
MRHPRGGETIRSVGEKAPTARAWLRKRWVQTVLVLVAFAALAAVFTLYEDRKDSGYWSGYIDAQRWVDDGGYTAHEESVADFCRTQAASHRGSRTYERGCLDGAHNAMRSPS